MKSRRFLISGLLLVSCCGCAFHYYDADTGTEHIWGFGHMAMKLTAAKEGVRAAVVGTEVLGIGISHYEEDLSFLGGWRRDTRLKVLNDDTSVRLEWPSNDMFNVRVGSLPPFLEKTKKTD